MEPDIEALKQDLAPDSNEPIIVIGMNDDSRRIIVNTIDCQVSIIEHEFKMIFHHDLMQKNDDEWGWELSLKLDEGMLSTYRNMVAAKGICL